MENLVEIFDHNKNIFKEVSNILHDPERSRAIVTEFCGLGKSQLISRFVFNEFPNSSCLIVFNKQSTLDAWNHWGIVHGFKKEIVERCKLVTYTGLATEAKNNENYIQDNISYDFIIFDEMHHMGAKTYFESAIKLINANHDNLKKYDKHLKVLGLSATPNHYSGIDLVKTFFNGELIVGPDLMEALSRGLLRRPIYVCSVYGIINELNKAENKVNKFKNGTNDGLINKYCDKIENFKLNYSDNQSLNNIIKDHVKPLFDSQTKNNKPLKIVVFASTIESLKNIHKDVLNSMYGIFDEEIVHSAEFHNEISDIGYNDFNNFNSPGEIYIIFSVNKFNEGLHLENVACAMFFRKTASDHIYLQQIGRVLDYSSNIKHPLIIDMVNNFRNLEFYDIISELPELEFGDEKSTREEYEEREKEEAYVFNYIKDIYSVINEIDSTNFNNMVLYEGEYVDWKEKAKELHKNVNQVRSYMKFSDLTAEEAIKFARPDYGTLYIEEFDETKTINEWSKMDGAMTPDVINSRIASGKFSNYDCVFYHDNKNN